MANELQGKWIAFLAEKPPGSTGLWKAVESAGGHPEDYKRVRNPHREYDGFVLSEGLADLDWSHKDSDVTDFMNRFLEPDVIYLKTIR